MCGTTWVACTKPIPSHGRRSGYESWGTDSPAGSGQSPGGKRILAKIFCKLTLFGRRCSFAISDPISDVHWLVRRRIGSAARGCAKLVAIRMLNMRVIDS